MPRTPNYGLERRNREKKRTDKQEQKRKEKEARRVVTPGEPGAASSPDAGSDAGAASPAPKVGE